MARGQKRAASRAAAVASRKVAKQCATIAPAIKNATALPQPVRKIVAASLVGVFGTYKEDRHEFQNTVSELVAKTLRGTEADLKTAIANAETDHSGAVNQGAASNSANQEASAASEAAAKAATECADELANCKNSLKDAKAALHDAEEAVKTLANDTSETKKKREGLDVLNTELFIPVKEGTVATAKKSATSAGNKLSKEHDFQAEFVTCVVRSFSKGREEWGTFDNIVSDRLNEQVAARLAFLDSETARMEGQKAATDAAVETAQGAVTAAGEKVTAAEEAVKTANEKAKEAKAAAKTTSDDYKKHETSISKAASALADAQKALTKFQETALAAYDSAVEYTAPPPPPEVEVEPEAEMTATLEQAMTAAPIDAAPASPSMLPSPGVLLQRGLSGIASAVSSRLAPSPRVAQSPGQ